MSITDQDTDQRTDTVLARVRKLLAKAEDPAATTHEAETYTAKASELMAAYGIDRALLAASDPSLDVVGDRVIVHDRPYAAEKAQLVGEVAISLGCRVVRRTRYPEGEKELSSHLFGHRSDLERAEILFTSLLLQAMQALARTPVPSLDHPAAFRRSWLTGFSTAVGRRLERAERAAAEQAEDRFTASGTSTALVLADRSTAVEAARDATYPDLRTLSARRLSGSGQAQGWAAGQRADLGGARLGGHRRQLRG
jgi:hypothetical protein